MPAIAQSLPFVEALELQSVKTILPTEFRTFLLNLLPPQIRMRAFFSAGVTKAEWLENWHHILRQLANGEIDLATARLEIKQQLSADRYQPPENGRGGLLDLSSDTRSNLILETNLAQIHGFGQFVQHQQQDVLDLWPAQELVRVIDSKVKRNWPSRWKNAGLPLYQGRMIVLLNDRRILRLSRFGTPWTPLDFKSGMRWRPRTRQFAEEIGLLKPGQSGPTPAGLDLNKELQATPRVRSDRLRQAIQKTGLGKFDKEGVLRPIKKEPTP